MLKLANIDDLKFVRTYEFTYIPRYLFEQINELDSEAIDRIYQLGLMFSQSPLTLLYVLVDEVQKIKGVLWGVVDVIEGVIYVKVFSVDKEYQSADSMVIKKAVDHCLSLTEGSKLKKEIRFQTTHPDAYEKVGAKRSKYTLMEFTDGTDNQNNQERENIPDTGESD